MCSCMKQPKPLKLVVMLGMPMTVHSAVVVGGGWNVATCGKDLVVLDKVL